MVIITAGDRVIARALADGYREDLRQAGIGDGRHGFELLLDPSLSVTVDHLVCARRESDGSHLEGSPCLLRGAAALSEADKAEVSALLATACDEKELDARLTFIGAEFEALRRRRAFTHGARDRTDVEPGADAGRRRRALVIDDMPPRTGHDAGSNAVLSHMLSLQRLGFAVSFVAADLRVSPDCCYLLP